MTSGIYRLNFNDEMFYIGQAQDIHARLRQHMDNFQKGRAAQKMQLAYNKYGVPEASVLIYCHKDYLDIMETYYINELAQYTSCLNTSIPKLDSTIDYEILLSSPSLLESGSMAFINKAIELTKENLELDAELSVLKTVYNERLMQLRVAEEVKQGRDENKVFRQMYPTIEQAYKESQALLAKHQNRNLLQRIFNYD